MTILSEAQFVAGVGTRIEPGAIVGHPYDGCAAPARLGDHCHVRTGTVVYADVVAGDRMVTGVNVLIREQTAVGDDAVIGSAVIVEGHVEMGNQVVLQSGVFVPTGTRIADRVFIGPRAVLTNDRYPLRMRAEYRPEPPVLETDATVGANATLLPGVRIGEGAMVAAGAVVTRDVPAWTLAVGSPAQFRDLPSKLREPNTVRRRR